MTALTEHRNYLNDVLARQARRRLRVDTAATSTFSTWPSQPVIPHDQNEAGPSRPAGVVPNQLSKANVVNYIQEEETVRNDYTAWYGASGEWGSNFVLGAEAERICEE